MKVILGLALAAVIVTPTLAAVHVASPVTGSGPVVQVQEHREIRREERHERRQEHREIRREERHEGRR
jgi:anti-sigma factor RsiW